MPSPARGEGECGADRTQRRSQLLSFAASLVRSFSRSQAMPVRKRDDKRRTRAARPSRKRPRPKQTPHPFFVVPTFEMPSPARGRGPMRRGSNAAIVHSFARSQAAFVRTQRGKRRTRGCVSRMRCTVRDPGCSFVGKKPGSRVCSAPLRASRCVLRCARDTGRTARANQTERIVINRRFGRGGAAVPPNRPRRVPTSATPVARIP
jgi:hypothetical protein